MLSEDLREFDETLQTENYPVATDNEFTPDEIESIKAYKEQLSQKLNKNRSVLKGLEVSFWGVTSYSIARFMILTAGYQGIALAFAVCFFINQISNRECIDAFNINRRDKSWEIESVKLLKFGFGTVVTAFVMWSALGDFLQTWNHSKETYAQLENKIEQFNRLPENHQNKFYIIGGLLALGGAYTLLDRRGK